MHELHAFNINAVSEVHKYKILSQNFKILLQSAEVK